MNFNSSTFSRNRSTYLRAPLWTSAAASPRPGSGFLRRSFRCSFGSSLADFRSIRGGRILGFDRNSKTTPQQSVSLSSFLEAPPILAHTSDCSAFSPLNCRHSACSAEDRRRNSRWSSSRHWREALKTFEVPNRQWLDEEESLGKV